MTIECTACHARYTIADSLVPPQGARVKCKKCGAMISIRPPAAIPAPTDVPLVPPTPEPPAPPPPAKEPAPPAVSEAPRIEAPSQEFERFSPPPAPAMPPAAPAMPPPAPPPPPPAPEPVAPEPSHATAAFEHFVEPARGGPSPSAIAASHAAAPSPFETSLASHAPAEAPHAPAPPSHPHAPAPAPREAPSPAEPAGVSASIPSAGSPIPEGLSPEERQRHERARRLARVLASDIAIYNREKRDRGIHDGNLVAVLGYEIKKSWDIYKEKVGAEFANGTPYFRDALNEIVAEGRKIF